MYWPYFAICGLPTMSHSGQGAVYKRARDARRYTDTRKAGSGKRILIPAGTSRAGAAQIARRVGATMKKEIKYVDDNSTGWATGATPQYTSPLPFVSPANAVPVIIGKIITGAGPNNRIGSKVVNKSLHIRGTVGPNQANVTGNFVSDILRVVVVYDEQTNGAPPAFTDIFTCLNWNNATDQTAFASLNMNNRDRFKVLVDEQFLAPQHTQTAGVVSALINLDTTGNASAAKWNFERFIRLPPGMVTHYKASTGVVGDVATGGLFILAFSGGGGVYTACPWSFYSTIRLRYDDY